MSDFFYYIARFALIVMGYCFAVLGAGFFLNALILATLGVLPHDPGQGFFPSLLFSSPFMGILIGYFAFFPSLAAIAWGEFAAKRDWLFYALAGLVIAVVLAAYGFNAGIPEAQDPVLVASAAGAGVIGGFVYWLVAGRFAGRRRS
ncbi:hypothetical protein DUT91_05895 [Phyllobacterium salinisoli]|uniref:Uncharacterized protein n=1 Tax=Phyllobacterium salinisoli TaxID=1899321 RepID=A0A368K6Y7_9HYPH|nr:hypothetical protein [Phyllobacterium salinisoli]RCS24974.1 hypothetical protein DUT91_05895 [Phyllobacterium salinisoli]